MRRDGASTQGWLAGDPLLVSSGVSPFRGVGGSGEPLPVRRDNRSEATVGVPGSGRGSAASTIATSRRDSCLVRLVGAHVGIEAPRDERLELFYQSHVGLGEPED